MLLSILMSFLIFYLFTENIVLSLAGSIVAIVFHLITKPKWMETLRLFLILLFNVPKAIVEGFFVIFLNEEYFEIKDTEGKNVTEMVLSITLTPKTIVFLEGNGQVHIHALGRRRQ